MTLLLNYSLSILIAWEYQINYLIELAFVVHLSLFWRAVRSL